MRLRGLFLVVALGAALAGTEGPAESYFRSALDAIRQGAFREAEAKALAGLHLDPGFAGGV